MQGAPAARKVFAKGLPSTHRRVITQAREAAVAPLVKEISPALLWHFDEAGWNVLGYEYAPGRHADYSPGSPDLDRLVQLMDALSQIKVKDDPGPFKRAEDRYLSAAVCPRPAKAGAGPDHRPGRLAHGPPQHLNRRCRAGIRLSCSTAAPRRYE